jgi:undecaprenyl-diphosphatase
VGIAVGVLVLALLAAGVVTGFGPQLRLDDAASRFMYIGDSAPAWLHHLLSVVTAPGLTVVRLVVFLPVVVWLVRRRAWWTAAWVVVAVGGIGPVTSLLKALFDRVRPQFQNGGAGLSSLSFPSGHSSGIATLVTVALVLAWPLLSAVARRRCLVAGVVVGVVVGLSRMWLGLHYLTDVLGGWSLGVAWSLAVALAFGGLPGGRAALPARSALPAEPS